MPQARDAAAGAAHAADECSSSSAGWMTVQVKRSSKRGVQAGGSQQPGSAKSDSAAAASCRSPLQPSSPAARYQLLSFQHAAAQPFTSSHTASTQGRGVKESAVDTRRCSYARAAEATPSAAPLASQSGVAGQLGRRPGGCTTNAWAVPALPALLRQQAADAQAGSAASGATSAPAPGSPAAHSELVVPTADLSSPPAAVSSPSRYLPPHQRRQQPQQQEPQPAASCLGSRTTSDDHAGWPVGLRGSSISCPGSCVAAEQEGDEGAAGGHMEPAAAAAAAAAAELRAAEQRPLGMLRMPAPSHVPCKQSPDLHLDHGSCWPPLCSTRASAKAASQAQKQQEEDDDAPAVRQVVDPAEQPQAGTPCSWAAGQATATSGTAVAQPEATPAAQPHEQQRACVVGDVAQREAAAALVGGHGVPGELPVAGSSGSAALLVPPGTPVPQSPVMLPPSPPLLHPMWAPLMSRMATSTPFGFGFGFAAAAAQLPSHMLEDGQVWGFPAPMHVRVTAEGAQAICALDMALPPPATASTLAAAAGLPAALGSPACSAAPALASPHMPTGTTHHPAMGPLPYHATFVGPAESEAGAPHMNPFTLVSKGRVVPHLDSHRPLQPGPAEDLRCYWPGEQPPMMVPYAHHRSQQVYARDIGREGYAPPRNQAPYHAAAYSGSRPPAYTPRQAPRQIARGPYAISPAPAPARSPGSAPCSNSSTSTSTSSSSSSTAPTGVAATPMGAPGPAAEQGTAVSAVKQASLVHAPSFAPAAVPACDSVAASCCSEGDSPRTSSGLTSLVACSSSFGGCACDELDGAAAGHESGPGPAAPPPPAASSTTAATTESSSGYAASTASSAVVSVASPPPSSCPSMPASRTNSSSSSNGSAFAPQQWRGHAYPPTLSGPGGRGQRGRSAAGDPPPPGGRLPVVLSPSPGGQQWQHQDRPGYGPGRRPTNPRWRGYPQQHAPPRQQQVPGPMLYPAAQHGMWPAAGAPLMYMLPVPGTAPPGSPPGWVTPVAVPAPPAPLAGTRL